MQKAEEYYKQLTDENFEESINSAKILQHYIKTYTARYHGYYVHTLYMPKMFTEKMADYFNEIFGLFSMHRPMTSPISIPAFYTFR